MKVDAHELRTRALERAIEVTKPPLSNPTSCSYLDGRQSRNIAVFPTPTRPGIYHALMDLNFRRAGGVFYRPSCADCDECRMIRVPVEAFRASRAQRRCWQRNADLEVRVERASPTEEKLQLYRRYLSDRHDGQMTGSAEEFREFLYTSPIRTHEISYRLAGRLVGVGVIDIEPQAMSAVYCYYDPEMPRRSLGVFNVLQTIEQCRVQARPYLYLGFFIKECQAMSYKANYRPAELLEADGQWVPLDLDCAR